MLPTDVLDRTFSMQNTLPSLPVPKLSDTLQKYLKTVSALVSKEQFAATEKIVHSFERSRDAALLQEGLVERSKLSRNWMEEWWYDAYNSNRAPLLLQNMGAIVPRATKTGDQLTRAGEFVFYLMSYWLELRRELISITTSRKEIWDMDQFYNVFNSCRSASLPKDCLKRFFKTETEGSVPSQIIVISDGQLYSVNIIMNGRLLPKEEIYRVLTNIKQHSAIYSADPSVISLTTEHRDDWAMVSPNCYNFYAVLQIKEELSTLSLKNKKILYAIESAVFVLSLSSDTVETESELMYYSLFGNPRSSWCDKNFTVIVLPDGQICYNADHCNVDAIALFTPADYAAKKLHTELWDNLHATEVIPFEHLFFDVPDGLTDKVYQAERNFYEIANRVDLIVHHYNGFGNVFFKENGIYTDTIIQIALQLAYYRIHNSFAPTYETASTRKFYHGRTETVRSCTPELVEFVNVSMKGNPSKNVLRKLLYKAYDAHNDYMGDARNAQGIDRHMYGLQIMQQLFESRGLPVSTHGLFDDPSWKAAGGSGSFRLSTSFLGYDQQGTFGYVTAMCTDGYGIFYRINPNSLTFTVTCFKETDTSAAKFASNIDIALNTLHSLLDV